MFKNIWDIADVYQLLELSMHDFNICTAGN